MSPIPEPLPAKYTRVRSQEAETPFEILCNDDLAGDATLRSEYPEFAVQRCVGWDGCADVSPYDKVGNGEVYCYLGQYEHFATWRGDSKRAG